MCAPGKFVYGIDYVRTGLWNSNCLHYLYSIHKRNESHSNRIPLLRSLNDYHRLVRLLEWRAANPVANTFEFSLNDFPWIHRIQWIMTKSKNGEITMDALYPAIDIYTQVKL